MLRAIFPATFLISACALGYEILLMRVLSIVQWQHFAYMIISLALLGYGASGTFIALARPWLEKHFATAFSICAMGASLSMMLCFIAGQRVPFNAPEVVWDPQQFLYLAAIYLIFIVPFFFAATCIGLAFSCLRAEINRIYFLDLVGAAAGAALVVAGMFVMSPQTALRLLTVAAMLAAIAASFASPRRSQLLTAQLLTMLAIIFAVPAAWLEFRPSPYKPLSQTLQIVDTRIIEHRSSTLGQLTVVESPTVPFRYAPGLSLNSPYTPPDQLALFTDGGTMSTLTRFDGDCASAAYLGDTVAAIPFAVLEAPRTLVLGAGGGTDVLLALCQGAASIDVVEADARVIDLVSQRFGEFTGHLYEHSRVRVHTAESRSFVARSQSRYDLIQLSGFGTSVAVGSGTGALNENYVYTLEALQEYLSHLAPGGILAVTGSINLPPRASLKLLGMTAEAVRRSGVDDPGQRVAMIRNWNTATLMVRNGDFSASDIESIRNFTRQRSFDAVWHPGMQRSDANRYNRLDEPWLHDGARALLGDNAGDFIRRYKFHIGPATDDSPYFSHFFQWRAFDEVMNLRARGGAGLVEWGYLILLGTLVQALVAGAVLILLPLSVQRPTEAGSRRRQMGSYFFLLGLAFMFIEIAFIQKFILFLGHPVFAVAVVLSGFLVFAGIGSACARRMLQFATTLGRSPVDLAVAGIVIVTVLYLFALPRLFDQLIVLSPLATVAASLLLIAPLAFFMGMPLPLGLAQTARVAPSFIPWAWGLNGFASVTSAALASLLAIELGFTVVILLALALYVTAALCSRFGTLPSSQGTDSA